MNTSVSLDIPENHDEDRLDWRLKACELLEKHIDEIKLSNANLVLESCVLASCLRDLLTEVESLKTSVVKSLDDEKIMEYLLHYQSVISLDKLGDGDSSTFTEAKYSTKRSDNLSHCAKSKNSSLDIRETRPIQDNVKQSHEDISNLSIVHDNDNRPTLHKHYAKQLDVDCDDPELTRSAFRLFAKHIGPSLKREHRMAFNALPTQDWLANQLLSRWEELSEAEKFAWRKRVKSS
ncbi:unnamed protein product [Schistosoma turkestanicum]|nr:unnamed protein product [Schistosoma turkestanicum]